MTGLLELSAVELLSPYARGEASPVEVVEARRAHRASRRAARRVHGALPRARPRRGAEAEQASAAARRGRARRDPVRGQGPVRHRGRRDDVRLADVRRPRAAADAEAVRRARAAGAILVGKTQTHEFAWGITSVNETAGHEPQPVGARPRLGRLERRLRSRARQRTRCRSRSAATPAARSACPRRSAASSASSRPTAGSARPGPGRSRARSTTRARWRERPPTRRCCSRRSPASTRAIPRPRTCRSATSTRRARAGLGGLRRRHLPRPAPRPARARRRGGLRRGRARGIGAAERGLKSACRRRRRLRHVRRDAARRGALHAPRGRALPGARGEYGADVLGRLETAAREGIERVPARRRRARSASAPRSRALSRRSTCC